MADRVVLARLQLPGVFGVVAVGQGRGIRRVVGVALCRHTVHCVVTVAGDNPSCVCPVTYIAVCVIRVDCAPRAIRGRASGARADGFRIACIGKAGERIVNKGAMGGWGTA